MITFEQAKQLAIGYINSHDKFRIKELPNDSLVLEHSSEFDNGWIFYFNSKLFLETRNIKYRPLGLGTIIVGKKKGEIFLAGSGGNEEYWITKFNEQLSNKQSKDYS